MAAVALGLERGLTAAGERPQRGEDVRELCLDLTVEYPKSFRLEAPDVLVQRIDEEGERQIVLELRRRSGEDEVAARLGASGELSEKPRLADPRFAR